MERARAGAPKVSFWEMHDPPEAFDWELGRQHYGNARSFEMPQDWHMIEIEHGVRIHLPPRHDSDPPAARHGSDVMGELGGRFLLNYVAGWQVGRYDRGRPERCWVTPTLYAPEDVTSYILPPVANETREYAYLLDPSKVALIEGPMWVAVGGGIQYVLPVGYPEEAIYVPDDPTGHWAIRIH